MDYINVYQEGLVQIKVLTADFGFENYKKLVPMQFGAVPVTYTALECDYGFRRRLKYVQACKIL